MRSSADRNLPGISGQRLTLPAELEDGHVPARIGHLANYVIALIAGALLWASFAEIRERVVASGAIIPSGRVQQIEHLEGGEVQSVRVIEGQVVEAGAALLELRPTAATSDLHQLEVRAASLKMQLIALGALINGKEPDFGEVGGQYPDLLAEQRQVYSTKQAHIAQERRSLTARVAQKQAEIGALAQETESLKRQLDIQREQLGIREELLKDGYTSRRSYLTTKTALEEATAKYVARTGQLAVAREALAEAQSTLKAFDAKTRKTLSEERSAVVAELAELAEQLGKHQDRVDRLIVRAPIRGIVQELAQTAAGEVVRPGDLVAKVVPLDRKVVAEVRVDPKDIGHIKKGDPVEVKLSTFDPSLFGVAKGQIQVLSASTFVTEEGEPYYKAIVELAREYIGEGNRRRAILPGMVVEADIVTGSKSLVRYMLAPVYRSLDTAFSER